MLVFFTFLKYKLIKNYFVTNSKTKNKYEGKYEILTVRKYGKTTLCFIVIIFIIIIIINIYYLQLYEIEGVLMSTILLA